MFTAHGEMRDQTTNAPGVKNLVAPEVDVLLDLFFVMLRECRT